MVKKQGFLYLAAVSLLFFSLLLAMRFGAVNISIGEIWQALGQDGSKFQLIFYQIRLPRVILGAIMGAGLAMTGAVMQGIFQNPLVDSYTLGMSSGASLGAVLAIITGVNSIIPGISGLSFFAFLGALATLALVYALGNTKGKLASSTLLLAGIVVSYFIAALISVLMLLNKNKIDKIVFWNMGSLAAANWNKVLLAAVVILPCSFLLYYFWRELNMLSFGEEAAKNLGVNTTKAKAVLLVLSALIVGTVVAIGGTIGFVGLIAPHIVRYFAGVHNKQVLFLSAITGATVLVLADTLGRVLVRPAEIPAGVMTSVIAGPFFIYLLRKQKSPNS